MQEMAVGLSASMEAIHKSRNSEARDKATGLSRALEGDTATTEAMEILTAQDADRRANAMTLLADGKYSGWKILLEFESIKQQAYGGF